MIKSKDIAKKYSVSARTVYRWKQIGLLVPVYEDGSRSLFNEDQVEKALSTYKGQRQYVENSPEMPLYTSD